MLSTMREPFWLNRGRTPQSMQEVGTRGCHVYIDQNHSF